MSQMEELKGMALQLAESFRNYVLAENFSKAKEVIGKMDNVTDNLLEEELYKYSEDEPFWQR